MGRASAARCIERCNGPRPAATDHAALAAAAVAEFELPSSAAGAVADYARTIRDSAVLQRFFDPAAMQLERRRV